MIQLCIMNGLTQHPYLFSASIMYIFPYLRLVGHPSSEEKPGQHLSGLRRFFMGQVGTGRNCSLGLNRFMAQGCRVKQALWPLWFFKVCDRISGWCCGGFGG